MFRAADELALRALRDAMHEYAPLTDATWGELAACCRSLRLAKGEFFCRLGAVPREFGFVVSGLLRCFVSDAEGNEYNKIFFEERSFPGPMAALLESRPSAVALQALEDSLLVAIDFAGFRALLERSPDLMWFQIRYLERNWLLMKEPREFALVQDEAAQRYRRFKQDSPGLAERLPLFHIASHLGITPTQLSRIRRAERGESGA
jgi:CRP-like cAMP-binding protein